MEWLDKFAQLFSSGGDPSAVLANFWPLSGENLSNDVGFTFVSEWEKFHQRSGELWLD